MEIGAIDARRIFRKATRTRKFVSRPYKHTVVVIVDKCHLFYILHRAYGTVKSDGLTAHFCWVICEGGTKYL